jgi:hypothetical protein
MAKPPDPTPELLESILQELHELHEHLCSHTEDEQPSVRELLVRLLRKADQ